MNEPEGARSGAWTVDRVQALWGQVQRGEIAKVPVLEMVELGILKQNEHGLFGTSDAWHVYAGRKLNDRSTICEMLDEWCDRQEPSECPFCGGDAKLREAWENVEHGVDFKGTEVRCGTCGANIRVFMNTSDNTAREALARWNARINED